MTKQPSGSASNLPVVVSDVGARVPKSVAGSTGSNLPVVVSDAGKNVPVLPNPVRSDRSPPPSPPPRDDDRDLDDTPPSGANWKKRGMIAAVVVAVMAVAAAVYMFGSNAPDPVEQAFTPEAIAKLVTTAKPTAMRIDSNGIARVEYFDTKTHIRTTVSFDMASARKDGDKICSKKTNAIVTKLDGRNKIEQRSTYDKSTPFTLCMPEQTIAQFVGYKKIP